MTKSAGSSSATTSSTDTENSRAPYDLADLQADIPTTAEDVRVLGTLRRQPGKNLLPYIDELLNPDQFRHVAPRRTTSEGYEPFELGS